jgi:hypothetical protein
MKWRKWIMAKCQIQWIDATGQPTPDTNESIGLCWTIERMYVRLDGSTVTIPRSQSFNICREHFKRFQDPGMDIWVFEKFPGVVIEEDK